MAFLDAARKAARVLLEPIMSFEVAAPREYIDDILRNLSSRRGRLRSREDRGDVYVVTAWVPLADLFGYAGDLQMRTRGRGTFRMELATYAPVERPDDAKDDDDPGVRSPRHPALPRRASGIALPEPEAYDPPN